MPRETADSPLSSPTPNDLRRIVKTFVGDSQEYCLPLGPFTDALVDHRFDPIGVKVEVSGWARYARNLPAVNYPSGIWEIHSVGPSETNQFVRTIVLTNTDPDNPMQFTVQSDDDVFQLIIEDNPTQTRHD